MAAVPVLVFLFSTAWYFGDDRKEDWRGAAHLIATEPDCRGPVLVGHFNALGLLYYGLAARRPIGVFLPDARRGHSVEFALTQRLMHPDIIAMDAIPAYVTAHPGTTIILPDGYAGAVPAAVQALMARAPLARHLDGELTVACFAS